MVLRTIKKSLLAPIEVEILIARCSGNNIARESGSEAAYEKLSFLLPKKAPASRPVFLYNKTKIFNHGLSPTIVFYHPQSKGYHLFPE